MQQFRPLIRHHGLTDQQWRVLRVLADNSPLDAGELAERTCLLASSLTRIIAHLSTAGLLLREVDPRDQRKSMIGLSEAGHGKYNLLAPQAEAIYQRIETEMGIEEMRDLSDRLAHFTDSLTKL